MFYFSRDFNSRWWNYAGKLLFLEDPLVFWQYLIEGWKFLTFKYLKDMFFQFLKNVNKVWVYVKYVFGKKTHRMS